jgi:hypothetical protein
MPFYDLLLYPWHRPGMKLAYMCSQCPACAGESAHKSGKQQGHSKKSQEEAYTCPFGGRKFSSYATETKRFLFQGVSQGQTAATAFEDLMDTNADREKREEEQETMRLELEIAFEQQEKAQREIQRAAFMRRVSDETREAGVPNHSAPMASISPDILQKQNNSVLMTTTAPLCVRCDIPMRSSSSLGAALPCVFVFFSCVVFVLWSLGQQRTQPSTHI